MGLFAHVGSGVFEPLQVIGVTAFGAAYALRAATLAREGRPVAAWRIACYFAGLALILTMFVSPVAHLGGELVLAHMAQHLVIGDVAALLIVLGLTRSLLQPVMALPGFDRLQALTLPLHRAAALDREPVHLAHPRRCTRARSPTRPSTPSSTRASSASAC